MSSMDLSDVLRHEQRQEVASNPDMIDLANKHLDANKDGSVMDELQSLAGNLFGKRQA